MWLSKNTTTQSQCWTEHDIISLLNRMDGGYHPTKEERDMLHERRDLILSDSTIHSLPESLGCLSELKILSLGFTSLTRLPESIGQLSKLEELDLKYTRITSLPNAIGDLSNLQKLNLSDSKITDLPDSIGSLVHLKALNLNGSQIKTLPTTIDQLINLQDLDVSITHLASLPEEICRITSLQCLYLHGTKISTLPEDIGSLINLRTLSLSSTPISILPESIGHLVKLQELYLSGTEINKLPETISKLVNLQTLGIGYTGISSLPAFLALGPLPIVDSAGGNTPGIYAGATNLPAYYFEEKEVLARYLRTDETVCDFREAKIVFLGDGNAGKTYTINRFMANGAVEPSEGTYSQGQTHGVKPYDYPHKKDNKDFPIHLWDFGGQELLHAMHRCFLTDNTVYVLMVSTRPSEHTRRLRYWLHSIRPYVKGAKVLVIVNVFDGEGTADIDEIGLKNEFKNELKIQFEALSVKDAEPEEFRTRIMMPLIQQAEEAEAATGQHPKAYMQIKDQVKSALNNCKDANGHEQGWISSADYIDLCANCGIAEPREQAGLLRYFTNLGICFSDIGPEEEYVSPDRRLIQPVWLTNALYAVIEECKPRRGWIDLRSIQDCLAGKPGCGRSPRYARMKPELRYDSDDCIYMLKVAQRYHLAFLDPKDDEEIFFPATCSYADKQAEETWLPEQIAYTVTCEVEYPYLSETVVQRLMLDCMLKGYQKFDCWRGGFHFSQEHCSGIVDVAEDDRVLRIELFSDSKETPIHDELRWFREHLGLPCNQPEGLKEYIVVGRERYSLQRLIHAKQRGITRIPKEFDANSEFEVSELLGSIPVSGNNSNAPDIDVRWERFAANYSDTRGDFERLCTNLFRLEYFTSDTTFTFIPSNPGIEAHPQKAIHGEFVGRLIGFQAKYFDGSVGYSQIKHSMEEALNYYHKDHAPGSRIEVILLYCNKPISQSDENGGPEGNRTFAETKKILDNAGVKLKVLAADDLLACIRRYPELVKQYFFK